VNSLASTTVAKGSAVLSMITTGIAGAFSTAFSAAAARVAMDAPREAAKPRLLCVVFVLSRRRKSARRE
jgi:hypothetical protein